MPNISSIFPEKLALSISFEVTSSYRGGGFSNTSTYKFNYKSAPLYTTEETKDKDGQSVKKELTAYWPDDLLHKLAKKLKTKRTGPGDKIFNGTTYEPGPRVDYTTLDNENAYVIKGVGASSSTNLSPTSTVVVGTETIENIGYYYKPIEKSLGSRRYGAWHTNLITKNTSISTNKPISAALVNLSGRPNIAANPCFGCIPIGYLGAAGATVAPQDRGPAGGGGEFTFGGTMDLKIGTITGSYTQVSEGKTSTGTYPELGIYVSNILVGYRKVTKAGELTSSTLQPLTDPFYSPVNVFFRGVLGTKWGEDLEAPWPYEDSFDLDTSYYSGLPNAYLYNKDDKDVDTADKYLFPNVYTYIFSPFDNLVGIFSRPFKNPFNTPSSTFCEQIYADNLKEYQKEKYELVISDRFWPYEFRFKLDETTGFPQKEGILRKLKVVKEYEPGCLDLTYAEFSYDGTNSVTIKENCGESHDENGQGGYVCQPCEYDSVVSISGTCTLEYEIA